MRPKGGSTTTRLVKDLRSLRVLVVHPRDRDGEEILRHLQRIGCQTRAQWPPLKEVPSGYDVVFHAVRPDLMSAGVAWPQGSDAPAFIAIVDYENPTVLEYVLQSGALAVVGLPVRPFGLLTNLVIARKLWAEQRKNQQRISRLETKLDGVRKLAKAKSILIEAHGISEEEAYRTIRNQAMAKRVTTEEIATAIINANEILKFDTGPAAQPKQKRAS